MHDIERRIDQILALDGLSAQGFSQILFGINGLFNQLASSEAERRTIAQSSLFQRANERLTELQRIELAALDQKKSFKVNGQANKSAEVGSDSSEIAKSLPAT